MNKTYSSVILLNSFLERFNYLKLHKKVGEATFGFNRYVNQRFYTSSKWRNLRSQVIVRDEGCDLACKDHPIFGVIHIHHIVPITLEMFENDCIELYDINNLICVSDSTHRALHYGDSSLLLEDYKPRYSGDTKLW